MSNINRQLSPEILRMCKQLMAAHPMLTEEEETGLFRQWQQTRDDSLRDKVLFSHVPFILKQVAGMSGYDMSADELFGYAWIGMVHAWDKFNPDEGARFNTYARWWVKAQLNDYITGQKSIVNGPKSASTKALFFNIKRIRAKLELSGNLSLEDAEKVKQELQKDVPSLSNLSLEALIEADEFLRSSVYSLDQPMGDDSDGANFVDSILDPSPLQDEVAAERDEENLRKRVIHEAINRLTERERFIFVSRRLKDPCDTLEVIAEKYNITRERVRQIEVKAFDKVQAAVSLLMKEAREESEKRLQSYRIKRSSGVNTGNFNRPVSVDNSFEEERGLAM